MTRSLQLSLLDWRSRWHRLRHDLAAEIVLAVCALVLGATFLYIVNDFINEQVRSLSASMMTAFAQVAAIATLMCASGLAAGGAHRLWSSVSMGAWVQSQGELASPIRIYRLLTTLLILLFWHGAGWLLVLRFLQVPSYGLSPLAAMAAWETAMLAISLGLAAIPTTGKVSHAPGDAPAQKSPANPKRSRQRVLLVEKVRPFWLRPPGSVRLFQSLALLSLVLPAYAAWLAAPVFVIGAASLLTGLLAASAILWQAAADLNQAWTDRSLGVTHDEFIRAYEGHAWIVGLGVGAACFGISLLAGTVAWQPFVLGAIPCVSVTWILFQMDAKRPAISVLVNLLLNLMVGTALLASWIALVIPPIVRYYAHQYQQGRFYRV